MEWKKTFDPEIVRSLTRGATYTPTINAIQLQKFSSDESKISVVVSSGENRHGRNMEDSRASVRLNRCWSSMIYNMQVEDHEGYGWQIKGIPGFWNLSQVCRKSGYVMMTWC